MLLVDGSMVHAQMVDLNFHEGDGLSSKPAASVHILLCLPFVVLRIRFHEVGLKG